MGDPLRYPQEARRTVRTLPQVRGSVTAAALSFDGRRRAAWSQIEVEAWRTWAAGVKNHLLGGLDAYLEEAAANLEANGVQVHWAADAAEARGVLEEIVARRGVRRVVKAKSMLSEELAVNGALEKLGVEVFETDLGEYLVQLLGQPPTHIVAPAIHLDLEEIRALFTDRLGTPRDAAPEILAAAARDVLREAFLTADLGMSGANFVVAETGTVALIENEGNIRLCTSTPPVHVAFVGIEKLLPRWDDLAGFLQLTARSATGQRIGTYVSLLQGPRRAGEPDGPEEMHVVFVDNGRSRLLADPKAWEVLRCVRCGSCQNACPVYRQTGGHAYGYVYAGPIGAVLDPGLLDLPQTRYLPYASSLCGACVDACPVRIPIPDLLLYWRRRLVGAGLSGRAQGLLLKLWGQVMTHPSLYLLASRMMRLAGPLLRSRRLPVLGAWNRERRGLTPSPKSFRRLWEEGIR